MESLRNHGTVTPMLCWSAPATARSRVDQIGRTDCQDSDCGLQEMLRVGQPGSPSQSGSARNGPSAVPLEACPWCDGNTRIHSNGAPCELRNT